MAIKTCYIPICGNTSINSDKIFVTVPKQPERRSRWLSLVGRKYVRSSIFCCEDHFDLKEDAENFDTTYRRHGLRLCLKSHVIPHLFIDERPKIHLQQITDSEKKRRMKTLGLSSPTKEVKSSPSKKVKKELVFESNNFEIYVNQEDSIPSTSALEISPFVKDIGVQATCTFSTVAVQTMYHSSAPTKIEVDNETDLEITSDSSAVISNSLGSTTTTSDDATQLVCYPHTLEKIKHHPAIYLGLPKNEYFILELVEEEGGCSLRDALIVLRKIKLNESNEILAVDFDVHKSSVARILQNTIPKFANSLKRFVQWRTAEEIQKRLPILSRAKFCNIQSIIDCFEVQIEKPQIATNQAPTYSTYKGANTMKYLISCTPDGLINYISEGFGGRISNTSIVEASDYFGVLPQCDVMADRGFEQIAALLETKKCKLIMPPSEAEGAILSKEDAVMGKRIAELRIIVDRVIGRLRLFEILKPCAVVNHKLAWLLDNIVIIASALCNIQGPLI